VSVHTSAALRRPIPIECQCAAPITH
jgi:hypothetical protein